MKFVLAKHDKYKNMMEHKNGQKKMDAKEKLSTGIC